MLLFVQSGYFGSPRPSGRDSRFHAKGAASAGSAGLRASRELHRDRHVEVPVWRRRRPDGAQGPPGCPPGSPPTGRARARPSEPSRAAGRARRSSNALTGCVNAMRRTSTSTRPCPSRRRRNSPSSENRKTSGPGGRPSGGPAPTSPTASRNTPNMRISAGTSQVVSASRPPGREDPCALGDCQLRAGEVWEPEVADHRVEGAVLERERLGVGAPELDVRMLRVGPGDHRLCDVHAPYRRSPPSRIRRHVPGSGGHVEHPRARTHPGDIQERLDQAARDGTEEPCVPLHPLFPGTRFKLIESVEIDAPLVAHFCLLHSSNAIAEPTPGQAVPNDDHLARVRACAAVFRGARSCAGDTRGREAQKTLIIRGSIAREASARSKSAAFHAKRLLAGDDLGNQLIVLESLSGGSEERIGPPLPHERPGNPGPFVRLGTPPLPHESPSPGGLAYFTAGISEIHLGWIV